VAAMDRLLIVLYFAVLVPLCCYGLHRAHLVYLCARHRRRIEAAQRAVPLADSQLPRVTVQLPLYNEATVVSRLLEAAGQLDYPLDRLEIQVLDDSSDETRALAEAKVAELRSRGINAQYIRRPERVGYKAGALEYGLQTARGEFIAIFDADFIPQPGFLRAALSSFSHPRVAMVQTRWAHLNRGVSLLTSVQALMLDGHHLVENRARFGSGCLWNFSGTGGIWRRTAIEDAGGWQHDTLTEDLDLSYRAQLRGWKFVYRPDVVTPAELPEEMSTLRAQQARWAKGTVQTARKLLGQLFRARLTRLQRVEAFFHLTPHFAYPLMIALSVLLLPALVLMPATDLPTMLLVDLPLCAGATGSLALFYATAERVQGRSAWSALVRLPALIALGMGLAPNQTKAVVSGLRCMAGEFVRTPKKGDCTGRYRQAAQLPLAEMGLAMVSAASVVAAIETEHWFATPFALLFTAGYAYVAVRVAVEQTGGRRRSAPVLRTMPHERSPQTPTIARAA
jgi:hypothetical protein